MDRAPMLTGILLAGGASRRFGRDKIVEPVDGTPLFQRPLRALLSICDEVVVVLAPGAPEPALPGGLGRVRYAHDELAFAGPLHGCATGLRAAAGTCALLAGGDMPSLGRPLLALLAERVLTSDAVVLADGDGARPLPAGLRVAAARSAAEELIRRGERRLLALSLALDAEILSEAVWRTADPAGAWRKDIDVEADLRDGGREG